VDDAARDGNSVEKSTQRIHKLRRQLVGLARYDATIARIRPIYNNACVTGNYSQHRRLRHGRLAAACV